MKLLFKSLAIGLIATGLFFALLMALVVPVMALVARSQGAANVANVVVDPNPFLRQVGLPMSGMVFLTTFGFSLRHAVRASRPTQK